jgi:hypothetical protein
MNWKALALAVALIAPPAVSVAQAEPVVFVEVWPGTAANTCAQALSNTAGRLGSRDLRIVFGTSDDLKALAEPPRVQLALWTGAPRHYGAINLAYMPFVFRDPAHFIAFTRSDLYREMKLFDQRREVGDYWIALAYGGFYQLFSRADAMTEPRHFFNRFVGGGSHVQIYAKFGAHPSVGSITGFGGDIPIMEKDAHFMSAVEEPLIDAYNDGLDRIAKFVNLDFSAVNPVLFYLEDAEKLPTGLRLRVTAWAEAAAAKCSAQNFETEQKTLDRLKAAGLTVVPVHRDAFVSAGWRYALTRANINWTADDFDRIEQLGDGPKPKRLPSALVRELGPKERARFLADSKAAAAERKRLGAAASLEESITADWAPAVADLADAVGGMDVSATAAPTRRTFVHKAMPHDKAVALLQEVDKHAAEGDLCRISRCAPIIVWCDAARTLWQAGEREGARRIFTFAERRAKQLDTNGASSLGFSDDFPMILATRVGVHDPTAPSDIAAAADAYVLPDSVLHGDYPAAAGAREFRVQYMVNIALLLQRIGNTEAMNKALARATAYASDIGSEQIGRVAGAYLAAGDLKSARTLAAKALRSADPQSLWLIFAEVSILQKPFGAAAAQLLEGVSDREQSAGIHGDYLTSPEESKIIKGWRGDWLDHLAGAAALFTAAGDMAEVARIRDKVRAAEQRSPNSKKFADFYEILDSLQQRGTKSGSIYPPGVRFSWSGLAGTLTSLMNN